MPHKILALKMPQSVSVTLDTISEKQLKKLIKNIQKNLQNPTTTHTHVFGIKRNSNLIQNIQNELSQTQQIQGLYLTKDNKLAPLTQEKKEEILQTPQLRANATTALPIAGAITWAAFLIFMVASNTTENSLNKSWGLGTSLQDTSIFLAFNSVFSGIILAAFLAAARLVQELPQEKIIAHPEFNAVDISSKTTTEELIGTTKDPGLLFNASQLNIYSTTHVADFSFLDTLVSNGGFNVPSRSYEPPKWVPYNGMILLQSDQIHALQPITRLSGRLFNLNNIPKVNIEINTTDPSSTQKYENLPTKNDSKNPLDHFIGRQTEIQQILEAIQKQTESFKNSQYVPCSILLHDTIEGTYGVGKTDLAEKIIRKTIEERKNNNGNILPPGTEVFEKNGVVHTRLKNSEPHGYMSMYSMGYTSWAVLGGTILTTYSVLYDAQKFDDFNEKSQARLTAFIVMCMCVSLGIGCLGVLAYHTLYNTYLNTSPNKISEDQSEQITQISSVPKIPEDIVGEYHKEIPLPQNRYSKSKDGFLIAENPYTIIECGAIDPLKSDSKDIQDEKKNFITTLSSMLETKNYNLGNKIKTPYKSLIFITSNRTKDNIPKYLLDQVNLTIGLSPIIPFNKELETEKLLILLKKENESQDGFPFTEHALEGFIEKIQFKGKIPENYIIIARQYWQILLPFATLIAAEKGRSVIDLTTFCEAWHAMTELTHKEYFDNILKKQNHIKT